MSKSLVPSAPEAALSTLFQVVSKGNPYTATASVILYLTRIRKTYQVVSKMKTVKEQVDNVLDHATPTKCNDVELKFDEDRMQDFIILYSLFVVRTFNFYSEVGDKNAKIDNEARFLSDIMSSFPLPIAFHSDLDFCIRLTQIIGNSYVSNVYPQFYTGVQAMASTFTQQNTTCPLSPPALAIRLAVDSDPLLPDFKEVCELMNKLAPGASKSVAKSYDAMILGSVKRLKKEWDTLLQVIGTLSTAAELSSFYEPTRKVGNMPGTERIPNFDSVALWIISQVNHLSTLYDTNSLQNHLVANAGPLFTMGLTPVSRAIFQVTEIKQQKENTLTTEDKIFRELRKLNRSLTVTSGVVVTDEDVEPLPTGSESVEVNQMKSKETNSAIKSGVASAFSSKASAAKRDKGIKSFNNKLK
jgi:hypothetical protein